MYERHFGLEAPPFRLSPDPDFLFPGSGHREAIEALRHLFEDPRPLLVIDGDLGAGKSTILRFLIAQWRAEGVSVGHLASTQLDAAEIVTAVAIQFDAVQVGEAPTDSGERLLQRFRGLNGGRAVLAIDEAQNLSPQALHALVALTGLAEDTRVALRICLVGHPELRANVARAFAATLDTLTQPMCHIGALGPGQTQGYVEHRLRKVGWAGVPSFQAAAFDEIQRVTEGIPRRINVLANRLLLAQMLAGTTCIDAACVVTVARALRAETDHERPGGAWRVAHSAAPQPAPRRGGLMLVAGGRSDHVKAVPLLLALEACADLPPPHLFSACGRQGWELNRQLHRFVGLATEPLESSAAVPLELDELSTRFEAALARHEPDAVVVFDGNARSQCCASICRERDMPLVHVGSDPQGVAELFDPGAPRAAIARFADLRFHCQPSGIMTDADVTARTVDLGNPLIDAVRLALEMEMRDAELANPAIGAALLDERRGYGVVALKAWDDDATSRRSQELLTLLREVSRDLPLVWPMRRPNLANPQLARMLQGCHVTCVEELGHGGFVSLLRDATCTLTDCLDVIEEAAALHVPAISLGARHVGQAADGGWLNDAETDRSVARVTRAVWQIVFNGGREVDTPPRWDGHAAPRMAAFLSEWLGLLERIKWTPSRSPAIPSKRSVPIAG
jgi:type II secretory pathway predicted ATPase ExeA/UDP-N-acetylglucosamine 2-epimerase